ncbi:tagaturonate reductase [Metabacillus litoralis]|uniref:Tagaturonate reductase n=1 Tax=Metabacillus litoralis TaxID=152268 RepID=A0A5C6W7M7_9BACI|nr:tagaturonate reductase [Metabacillus litoralis]TXC91806.1 tagaturonate reductase [Metabacillus litoralis]
MERLSKSLLNVEHEFPEKVLQFGTGNFLRAFCDWQIHEMNKHGLFKGSVVVVQSTENGAVDLINEQEGLYTLYLQGMMNNTSINEHEVIQSISRGINLFNEYEKYLNMAKNPDLRFIISNTTEAGISYVQNDTLTDVPQKSFPAKLTAFLYERYQYFNGDVSKGLIILPCELIEDNGMKLKTIIQKHAKNWPLPKEFSEWLNAANTFCNTLVDRIVPGFPKDSVKEKTEELGYRDDLIVVGEKYHLFVIEGPELLKEEFPAHKIGLNVHIVNDLHSYRLKKVRILNGAHTLMTPVAFLSGLNTVREAVTADVVKDYIQTVINEEIIPSMNFPQEEMRQYANDVSDRFKNPFIHHYLLSISLNSISKFKTRLLPTLMDYEKKFNMLPKGIVFSLSSLIYFYRGYRGEEKINLIDDQDIIALFQKLWSNCNESDNSIKNLVKNILSEKSIWGYDLTEIKYMTNSVTKHLIDISKYGMVEALQQLSTTKGEANEIIH